ncbi:MAG: tRNA glutamyl-Q(34) synthetase GluQRS, partial [Planctomycetes bacterium]|nr:tRNA glutamyl-Q(34) synthetase GluQRS [Planctomycetota bacterium]
AWLHARCSNGRLLLRIEDLDTPRTKLGAEQMILTDLDWLGLDWDRDGSGKGYLLQSERLDRYSEVLDRLKDMQLVYPCTCSRSEIEQSSSAPHESRLDGVVYPGTCASRSVEDARRLDLQGRKYAWRFRFSSEARLTWTDEFDGAHSLLVSKALGDFIVARNYGAIAYQLAVVVDDYDSGITHVVRGNDLVYSTFRQIAIYQALDWPVPKWLHLPLVVGEDGLRLAKRHGDTRLCALRENGILSTEILGKLAKSLGLAATESPIGAQEILRVARATDWLRGIPKHPVRIAVSEFPTN